MSNLKKSPFPTTAIGIIEMLEKQYANKPPSPDEQTNAMWFRIGQRDVINKLIAQKAKAEKD